MASLSQDMIREFRSEGCLFAVDFGESPATEEALSRNWTSLVLQKRSEQVNMAFSNKLSAVDGSNDFYSSKPGIIRYSGFPMDFDSQLAAYLNAHMPSVLASALPAGKVLDASNGGSSSSSSSNSNNNSNHSNSDNNSNSICDNSGVAISEVGGESGGGKESSVLEAGKRLRGEDEPGSISEPLESSKVRLVESERGCSAVSEGDSSRGLYGPFVDVLRRQGSLAKAKVFRNVKIVINSHVKYKLPLSVLLQSIIESDLGFEDIGDSSSGGQRLSWDVIVSLAGCEQDVPPRRVLVSEVADLSAVPAAPLVPYVTVVRSQLNSFDWTAKAALFKYMDDPLIASDYYFYILDTSKVDKNFRALSSQIVPAIEVSQVHDSGDASNGKTRWVVKSSDKHRAKGVI
jgi:hypothetical protein